MTAPDPHAVLAAHAAEREFCRPKLPTPAELSELRSYAVAVAALAAKADRLVAAMPAHQWRVRGAAAELAKLQVEAWQRVAQMEREIKR
jgi:hypothetical protein